MKLIFAALELLFFATLIGLGVYLIRMLRHG
jgi:hypothetical protein